MDRFKVYANTEVGDIIVERDENDEGKPMVSFSCNHELGKISSCLCFSEEDVRDKCFSITEEAAAVEFLKKSVIQFSKELINEKA